MKSFVVLLFMICCSTAIGEVSLRVCKADGTPLDSNTIMVGTQLTFIVSSNSTEVAQLPLAILGADANGILSGKEPYAPETGDWAGSHLLAAGIHSNVFEWDTDPNGDPANWFDMTTDNPPDNTGDWFVINYTATKLSTCTVFFYINQLGTTFPETEIPITFTHVPTRDFAVDGIVNFGDFAVLARNWGRNDCGLDNCEGANLNPEIDNSVDFVDLAYFAEYWLEKLY